MNPLSTWRAEEERFIEHLKFIGFTAEAATDPNGWQFASNPMAPAVGFRAGPHFLCLYADYPAGHHGAAEYQQPWSLVKAVRTRDSRFVCRRTFR
ncbi:MAG: hypothetical protein EBS90_08505 [Betaproteobacteria bacterium]|nr:hypothetical protein [Betaproteobacteria bacterium]